MKILFLSRWYPDPPDNGSKVRILHLLRALCSRHNVTLISFFEPGEAAFDDTLADLALDAIHVCPYRDYDAGSLRALAGYLRSTPRWLVDTYRPEMDALIRNTTSQGGFDLVIASQTPMAAYTRSFRGVPAIFEEVELGAFWPYVADTNGGRSRFRRMLTWRKHQRFMARLLPKFRLCTVVSEVERQLLASAVPSYHATYVIPNSVDLASYQVDRGDWAASNVVFTGSLRFAPNLDAMLWFVREVYPYVKAHVPDVTLRITGDAGSERLPADSSVILTGRVPDVHSVVATSAVSIAPIRSGGGTRVKVLEAMALGSPLVVTSKAVEGLEVEDGEHVLVRDDPHGFGRAVVQLLQNRRLARQLAANAFDLVRSRYDWRLVLPWFLQLVDQAAAVRPTSASAIPGRTIPFRKADSANRH